MTRVAPLTAQSEKDRNRMPASVAWLPMEIPWGAFTYADALVQTLRYSGLIIGLEWGSGLIFFKGG